MGLFHSTDMGDNLEEVVETEDCKVLRMKDPSGDGLMTIYRVFDGVYLMYNDFHMAHCYSRFNSSSRIFCIDHCREGRIEHRTDKDMRYYMEQGDLRMDRRVHHSGDMYFPVSHYHGITVGFFLDHAEQSVREAMPGVSFDLSALADKFCGKDSIYILRKHPSIEHIFSELYNVPARIRMDYFKIKVMELLVFLRALELSEYKDERPYFYSSQTEKIKAVHKLLTDDLTRNYTAEELAKRFDLSTATLKNGFKGVYGSPIYTYIRNYKMNVAASMLVTDRKKRIIEIASAVGYDSSSWTQFSTTAGTSASITLSSLSPNTSYTVKVRVRRQYNHVYGTSGSSTVKTLGGAVVNSVNTVTAGNATVSITINVTVYEASYANTLVLKNGGTTILSISGLSWSKGTANRTVTLTSAQRTTLLNAMAPIKSFTGIFAASSYSGTTQIGSTSSKTATVLTTATNSAPTISGFSYADSYTTTKNITGSDQLFVQDYSTLKVTPGTATAKNGASISNYTASCNGLSAANATGAAISVGRIAKSGSVTVTLSVTDSRGYTAETSQTVTVIPYTKPKISSVTLRRTNDIEEEMQLKFSGSISAVTVDGTQKNSVVYVRYRYKKTSESSYGSYTSIYSGTTKSGTSFSYSNLDLCSLDANSSYDFHLQIQDKLYSLSSLDLYFTVPQGMPLIALRKKKVGINTPDAQATLDVDGSIHMNGVNVHGKMGRVDGSTTDLNNVKTPGYYFAYSASTAKHFPTTTIGMLEVFLLESYFIQQRYTVYDGSKMYIRGNYGGTWSSWHTVSLTTVI